MKKFELSNYRKSFPWIPIVGVILVPIYHVKYGDVLKKDNPIHFIGSAFVQAIGISIPILLFALL